jgi:hypothetical protein
MKILRLTLFALFVFTAAVSAQTINPGQKVFINQEGPITLVIDAALAVEKIKSPYVMFAAYMVSTSGESYVVNRQDVVMIYNEQEYTMPTYPEWRKDYNSGQGDMMLFLRLGKETLALSRLRDFSFPADSDFFPILGRGPALTDKGSLSGMTGFRTKLYFKNPGFKKGDQLVIRVRDRKNPNVEGACAVILE